MRKYIPSLQVLLEDALQHDNFCAFVHFADPDKKGHETKDYYSYMEKALEVDEYIWDLIQLLPQDVDILYCSDHGFDFKQMGDIKNGHLYSPYGMLATNFQTLSYPVADMCSVGRLIYTLAGGMPDETKYKETEIKKSKKYRMYGTNLI